MTCGNDLPPETTPTAADPLMQQCWAARARHRFLLGMAEAPLTVVVAVSGGADSVALLHFLHQHSSAWGLTLHVAHLDHNLRPASSGDARFVAQLAAARQLPFHQQQLAPAALADSPDGLEAAARRARYQFLAQVALAVTPSPQKPIIALAHHADDQAETLLLHLVRGSGLRGLGGMRWVSERLVGELWPDAPSAQRLQSLQLVRPFLGVQRADLLRYLRTYRLPWREDSSNTDQQFVRNRLRHTVLPVLATINPNIVDTLGRTAQILQHEADRSAALDQAALIALLIEPSWSLAHWRMWQQQRRAKPDSNVPERIVLALAELVALPPATQRGVLREAIALLTRPETTLDFTQVELLLAKIQPPFAASGPHPLLADVAWSVVGTSTSTPARLSLHPMAALPFAPDQPFLDAQWRTTVGSIPLPQEGALALAGGWSLTTTRTTVTALPIDWRSQGQPWTGWLDADQMAAPVLTTPRPGQVFAPLGLGGRHKMLGDFFTDRKVPVALRSGWPIIVDQVSGEILWVCGQQPGHRARITRETQVVVRLVWEQDDKMTR